MDIDTIQPGADYDEVISGAIGQCDMLIAVIGSHWLDTVDRDGRRRIEQADDFVRREIAAALEADVPVLPVLVQGAAMPARVDLPTDIAPMARRNALELSDVRWHHDVQQLLAALEPTSASEPPLEDLSAGRRLRPSVGLAALGTVVVVVAMLAGFRAGSPGDQATHSSTASTSIHFRKPWGKVKASGNPIPGLRLSDSVTLTAPGAVLRAGTLRSPAPGGDPVPRSLRSSWIGSVEPEVVRLRQVGALRYVARLRGGGSQRLYVVATSNGSIALGCQLAASAPADATTACDQVAATLEPVAATASAPGADAGYALDLKRILEQLQSAIEPRLRSLQHGKTQRRAAAAARLSTSYARAAAQVKSLPAARRDASLSTELGSALARMSESLRAIAWAAERRDQQKFARARSQLSRAQRALSRSLVHLNESGYPVR